MAEAPALLVCYDLCLCRALRCVAQWAAWWRRVKPTRWSFCSTWTRSSTPCAPVRARLQHCSALHSLFCLDAHLCAPLMSPAERRQSATRLCARSSRCQCQSLAASAYRFLFARALRAHTRSTHDAQATGTGTGNRAQRTTQRGRGVRAWALRTAQFECLRGSFHTLRTRTVRVAPTRLKSLSVSASSSLLWGLVRTFLLVRACGWCACARRAALRRASRISWYRQY